MHRLTLEHFNVLGDHVRKDFENNIIKIIRTKIAENIDYILYDCTCNSIIYGMYIHTHHKDIWFVFFFLGH